MPYVPQLVNVSISLHPSLMQLNSVNKMTDADKVIYLTELLTDVMHTLEMKQYEIEDPTESHKCETQADDYHQKMLDILHKF